MKLSKRPIIASAFVLSSFALSTLLAPNSSRAEDENAGIAYANTLSKAFENVAQLITPSVVNVSASKKPKPGNVSNGRKRGGQDPFDPFREFFGDDFMDRFQMPEDRGQQGMGTGVIVDGEGKILTNNHVVGEADEINVRLHDGRTFKAEKIGVDPRSDLAVIKIKASGLTPAKLGDSDKLKIGEWVVASGNPFGLDNTITAGIVSAKGRSIMGGGQFEDFIQTDAAINPGNSGGPLVNLNGEVIGINTAIFSRSGGYMGIGFAIPINMAKHVMQSLITKGKVVRGWLGVSIQNLTEDLANSFNHANTDGALVGQVQDDSPAKKAGLQQGDIIVEFDNEKIKNVNQLRNLVAAATPGSVINLGVVREGRKESVKVSLEELPAQSEEADTRDDEVAEDIGLNVETLTSELARSLRTKKTEGVVVTAVAPGSVADNAGIAVRDIIISVNGKRVKNVKDFLAAATSDALNKGIRMIVETQGMERYVLMKGTE